MVLIFPSLGYSTTSPFGYTNSYFDNTTGYYHLFNTNAGLKSSCVRINSYKNGELRSSFNFDFIASFSDNSSNQFINNSLLNNLNIDTLAIGSSFNYNFTINAIDTTIILDTNYTSTFPNTSVTTARNNPLQINLNGNIPNYNPGLYYIYSDVNTNLCPFGGILQLIYPVYIISPYGCTDSTALNYDPNVSYDDSSCCYISGCIDPTMFNYDTLACVNNGTCIPYVYGCTDVSALNYDSTVNVDNGTCIVSECPTLEFVETFDNGLSPLWFNGVNSSNYWNINAYGTPSNGTGPSDDISNGGNYIYFETSTPVTYNSSAILSFDFDLSNLISPFLSFSHHMYGSNIGSLIVYVNDSIKWTKSGNLGNQWNTEYLDLSSYSDTINIKFEAVYGDGYQGDIAIDQIEIYSNLTEGCTDTLAINYDSNAACDDSSCIYFCNIPTGLQLQSSFDVQAWIEWDEMSVINDSVDYYKVLYKAVSDTAWLIKQKFYDGNQSPLVRVRLQFLIPNTQYEMKIKAVYKSGCSSDYSAISYFTTQALCPNINNLSVTSLNSTRASFTWDDTSGVYSFVRIKARVDTTNSNWFNVGGFGILYGIKSKTKNGLNPGQSYRAQARTWCDINGGPYRSPSWSSLIYWTQPILKQENNLKINYIDIYPNPSENLFNISFESEEIQDLKVRILNILGEEILNENLEQFIGEYTKRINLSNNAKGIYFLEIGKTDGIINKKLILQ